MQFSKYMADTENTVSNGDGEIRTLDPLLARQVLSQLSYTPMDAGLPSFEAIPYSLYLFQSASHLLHYPLG